LAGGGAGELTGSRRRRVRRMKGGKGNGTQAEQHVDTCSPCSCMRAISGLMTMVTPGKRTPAIHPSMTPSIIYIYIYRIHKGRIDDRRRREET